MLEQSLAIRTHFDSVTNQSILQVQLIAVGALALTFLKKKEVSTEQAQTLLP